MLTLAICAKKIRLFIIAVPLLILVGCAGMSKQSSDTEKAYYDSAQQYLEKRNYALAIERLEELKSLFPLGIYAKASTLDLLYARYSSNDFALALIDADRFIRLNPDSADIDYAWFVRSMSYYQLYLSNQGLFGDVDTALRSPEQGQKAFSALSSFTRQFQQSEYRTDALKAMVILKDSLARHELVVANYYIRRGAWLAAAERAQVVIIHYPGVSAEADALVVLIEAYQALNLEKDRAFSLSRLKQEFPDHASLVNGEYKSPNWQEERWWLKLITLGIAS